MDDALIKRCGEATELTLVTTAEAFCVEALTRTSKENVPRMLQGRIASMAKREVDAELLQPIIWQKVQNLA